MAPEGATRRVDLLQVLSSPRPLLNSLFDKGISVKATPQVDRPPVRKLQKQHRMLADEVVGMLADYIAGQSVAQLTKTYRLHRTTVLEQLKRNGVDRRPHVRKLTDEQVKRAGQLYATGISFVHVAEQFGVNAATIRREFAKAGIPIRPRRGWEPRGHI